MPSPFWYRWMCRACQTTLYFASFFIYQRKPKIMEGPGCVHGLPAFIKGKRLSHPMLVTDVGIMKIGLANGLIEELKALGVSVTVYHDVVSNPTLQNVDEAATLYATQKCDCLIGFGGGSCLDCAKLVGVRVVRPRTPLLWMRGILKVLWPLPPLFAVPTTAGTGTELTRGAGIRNSRTQQKTTLDDPVLVPRCVVLDAALTVSMSREITAVSGFNALVNAVEAAVNAFQTRQTRAATRMAVRLIFNNLKRACDEPENIVARRNMMTASQLAAVAVDHAYPGNATAAAHTLSGFYDIPHGLASAILLPYVLEMYGTAAHASLAKLGEVVGFCTGTTAHKAKRFIKAIRDLSVAVGIPKRLADTATPASKIQEEDIAKMAARAVAEANPLYPVPVVFDAEDFTTLIRDAM